MLKRQHSSGSEEQMLNGIRQASDKKTSPTNENHSWSSLEDLSKLSPYNEFEKESPTDRSPLSNLNNKKGNGRKAKSTRQIGENEIIAKGECYQRVKKGLYPCNEFSFNRFSVCTCDQLKCIELPNGLMDKIFHRYG